MRISLAAKAAFVMLTILPQTATAQLASDCNRTEVSDPPRIVYQCNGGIVLEAEAAAALGLRDSGPADRPEEVELDTKGVLIEVEPGSGPFQIMTPHAIAAVRGTVYSVDVTADMTAVFVERGEVAVSRLDGSDTVLLTEGLGVEVSPGQPVEVRRWPAARVEELMARFGR